MTSPITRKEKTIRALVLAWAVGVPIFAIGIPTYSHLITGQPGAWVATMAFMIWIFGPVLFGFLLSKRRG